MDVVENGAGGRRGRPARYDAVLMDVEMPEMDGLEATRRIIAAHGEDRPQIVAMTANAFAADREACFAAGMDDYLASRSECQSLRPCWARSSRAEGRRAMPAPRSRRRRAGAQPGRARAAARGDRRGRVRRRADGGLRRGAPALLDQAPATARLTQVRLAAHRLKSSAETFGAGALAELAARSSGRARGPDRSGAGGTGAAEFERVRAASHREAGGARTLAEHPRPSSSSTTMALNRRCSGAASSATATAS